MTTDHHARTEAVEGGYVGVCDCGWRADRPWLLDHRLAQDAHDEARLAAYRDAQVHVSRADHPSNREPAPTKPSYGPLGSLRYVQ